MIKELRIRKGFDWN